jgi:hypothetical protein
MIHVRKILFTLKKLPFLILIEEKINYACKEKKSKSAKKYTL